MSDIWGVIIGTLLIINIFCAIILTLYLSCEYDDNPPLFFQQHLWKELDFENINFIGKLILCILTTPFTIMYTVGGLGINVGGFLLTNMWKLFCLLFKKR